MRQRPSHTDTAKEQLLKIEERSLQLERHNNRLITIPMLLPLALCAVLTLAGLPTAIQAQNDNTQSIGFVVGSTHGIGISYARQNNQSGIGWQIAGMPLWTPETRRIFGAVASFKTLNEGKHGRVFLSFGISAHYSNDIYEERSGNDDGKYVKIEDENHSFFLGPGVGLERRYDENFTVSLEIPAAIHITDDGISILPIPNFAFSYRW